ncbi:hypothetical protein AB6735_10290 [Mucilaginibacter sp. RCC_168]|uniref:hypothetical protein n=1 Tax=Mucilaginibacter sp. RCC_168 TaxID=3239221 RepID=UPI003523F7D4
MNQEFPVSRSQRVFYFFIALMVFGFGVFIAITFVSRNPLGLLFGMLLCGSSILIVIGTLKRKIMVYDDRIVHINLFRTRELLLADVKGYRIGSKVIYIIPNNTSYSKITINNYAEYTEWEELTKWLDENFTDLDRVDYQADEDSILNDTRLGITETDKKSAIHKARITAIIYNVIGGLFFIFLFVFKRSSLFDAILIIYPLIAIIIIITSKDLIKLFAKPRTPYYSVLIGVYGALIPLFIKSIAGYNILAFNHVWLPFVIAAVGLGMLFLLSGTYKGATTTGGSLSFGRLLTGGIYGFCCVILINCVFDRSTEKLFDARVLSHSITHNKGTHYHLVIGPWGPKSNTSNIDISAAEYFQDTIGSVVDVHLKKGLLNIPWYTVSK